MKDAVLVDIKITEMHGLDEVNGTFAIQYDQTLVWYDQAFDNSDWDGKFKLRVECFTIPFILLDDVIKGQPNDPNTPVEERHSGEVTLRRHGLLDAPGTVYYTQRGLKVTVRDDNPLHDFPFDFQDMTLDLKLPGAGIKASVDYGRQPPQIHTHPSPAYHLHTCVIKRLTYTFAAGCCFQNQP